MLCDCFASVSAIFHAIDLNSGSYESSKFVESENRWVYPKNIVLAWVWAKTKNQKSAKNRFLAKNSNFEVTGVEILDRNF